MRGEADKIVSLRYKHHLNRIREMLNEVIMERNKIVPNEDGTPTNEQNRFINMFLSFKKKQPTY